MKTAFSEHYLKMVVTKALKKFTPLWSQKYTTPKMWPPPTPTSIKMLLVYDFYEEGVDDLQKNNSLKSQENKTNNIQRF